MSKKNNRISSAIGLLAILLKSSFFEEKEAPRPELKPEKGRQQSVEHALIMCRLQINASC